MGDGEGVWVILFVPRTVSKHELQLLPSKVPECDLIQNLQKKVLNHFFGFFGNGGSFREKFF